MSEQQGVGGERVLSARHHTRSTGRQNHENVLSNISSRVVAQVVDVLGPFLTENPNQSWTSALERAEKKVLRNLQAIEREGE